MKKLLSAMLLVALVAALCCTAFAAKMYQPDEADKNYGTAGWYTVASTVPEGITYSYLYSKPSSTKGDNLGKAENGAKVYVYYTTGGIGKKSTTWAYASCNGTEGFIRFSNMTTASGEPAPTATPAPSATPTPTPKPTTSATPRPTATATPRPTATATPRPTVAPTNPVLTTYTVVNCNYWVSLRETPSTSATRLKQVPKGSEVVGYRYDNTWTACYYDNEFGYILTAYLEAQ